MFQHLKKAVEWYCIEAGKNYIWSPLTIEAHRGLTDVDHTEAR